MPLNTRGIATRESLMDQDAFRETYRDVNERACVFERAVLTNQCDCTRAERFCIAEREGVACNSADGNRRCTALLDMLRQQARFALKAAADEGHDALPYGKAMRVQVGGLRGLHAIMTPDAPVPAAVPDVGGLLARAEQRFGTFEALPFGDIMPHIAAYKGRTRTRRRGRKGGSS